MYLLSKNKNECCGCTACVQICTHKALVMQEDEEGFLYPVKDINSCVNCGLCEKVCTFTSPLFIGDRQDVYASYLKDENERKKSSSGGVFFAISQEVIKRNGIVFGAVLDKDLKVKHTSAETLDELLPLRGSKYVQSDLRNTYSQIKAELRAGRLVYFTGTPCQVAGLKGFLRQPFDNLLTSDLVCHGVPSQLLFDEHLRYLRNKYCGDILEYKFRDDEGWGGCESVMIKIGSQIRVVKLPTYELSPFLYSFMYAMTYRCSCYNCPFSRLSRQSDITLADYWGVKEFFPQLDSSKGVSLVLVNTEKGKGFWNEVMPLVEYYESNIQSAAKNNANLRSYSKLPPIRITIYNRMKIEGYEKLANTVFRGPQYRKIKLRLFVKKLLGEKITLMARAIKSKSKIYVQNIRKQ